MRTFCCQVCGQSVYFENVQCTGCGSTLGFLPDRMQLAAVEQIDDGLWRVAVAGSTGKSGVWRFFSRRLSRDTWYRDLTGSNPLLYRQCANYSQYNVCNWMVPEARHSAFCPACRPNQVIPNLSRAGNMDKWYRIERSKRRLMYSLGRLKLPVQSKEDDPEQGLGFAFLSSRDAPAAQSVFTGHANGLITINIAEADPSKRERMRLDMDEKYRTLLGHFRHEIGHYYWDVLIRRGVHLERFRELFGDERADYAEALERHYAKGPAVDWQNNYVTAYASSHPWEDWAESWAHYLHIVDTLETASHFGIEVERRLADGSIQQADPDFDPYKIKEFQVMIDNWLPLTFAVNSLNRSMGQKDLYPFVLSAAAIVKLAYIHEIIRECH